MKAFLTLLAAFGLSSSFVAQAQDTKIGSVKGTVVAAQKGVESATVSLLKAKDSSIAKVAVSDKTGTYEMERIATGKYLIMVQAVGMQKKYSSAFELTAAQPAHSVGSIELTQSASKLADVTVNSKKQFIEQKAGKIVVNVEASPTSGGASALDMLEKSPGVSVDKDGNISLKGKGGVMVLLDGKPSYLSAPDLANLLKSMSSSNLDQIEIMSNPPAKYDAAGNSGIINIKTKKNIIKGMNGNAVIGVTQGQYTRTNESINLNYRNNKFNLFGGYNFNYGQNYNELAINRTFYEADRKTINATADQKTRPHSFNYNNSVKAGMDYYFSKKDVAGFVFNGFISKRDEDPASVSYVRSATGAVLSKLESKSNNNTRFSNFSVNTNYKHTFDSTGKEVTMDVDYIHYDNSGESLLSTYSFDAANVQKGTGVHLRGNVPGTINIVSGKMDFTLPFSKTFKLETGLKSSYVKTDNVVEYQRNNGSGWKLDDRSNQFLYEENINAAYASVNKEWKKVNLQLGVRVENTVSKGLQLRNDSSFKRDYTNVFPNAGLSFELNKKNSLSLSYSKRIDRPNYNDLNPFTYFLDSLTYGQGNPYLQPQFTNNFEVSHTYNRFLTTTINYSRTTDVITQLLKQNTAEKVTYQTRDNVSKMQQLGIAVMVNVPIKKWWNNNTYVNVFNNHYEGIYQADPIDIQFTTFAVNMTNSFTIGKKGWNAELSGFYRSKGADGLLVANQMYAVNTGVSKSILKKKGTLKLGIRDIFWTQRFSGYARYSDVDVRVNQHRDSRQANLTFQYRFGKTNIAPARRRTGGAGDEEKRAGQ
jgi:iron complex outermembrane receptor protein